MKTLSLLLVVPFLVINLTHAQYLKKCDAYELHIDSYLGLQPTEKIASVDMIMNNNNQDLSLKFLFINKSLEGSSENSIESKSYKLVDIDPLADVYISANESDKEQLFVWKSLNDQVPYKIELKVDGSDLYHLYCVR